MDDKVNYGCGMLGLIAVLGFFAFCGLTCAILDPLRDDCMDNDIFHSIESNGRAIVHVYYDGRRVEVPRTVASHPPSFKTVKLKDGNEVLKIGSQGKTWSRTDTSFDNSFWSNSEQCYYFIESKTKTVIDNNWLYRWSAARGFEELLELDNCWIRSISMSLDQSALVIDKIDKDSTSGSFFIVYGVADGKTSVLPHSDWATHPLLIGPARFLVRRHETGNYGHVVEWVPSQKEKPYASRDGLWIDGGEVSDLASLDGEMWGIIEKNGSSSIVKLSPDRTKVTLDVGWVQEAEQPYTLP